MITMSHKDIAAFVALIVWLTLVALSVHFAMQAHGAF